MSARKKFPRIFRRWKLLMALILIAACGLIVVEIKNARRRELAALLNIKPPLSWSKTTIIDQRDFKIGPWPMVGSGNLITIQTLKLESGPLATTAYLLIPRSAGAPDSPKPAIIALHGHVSSANELVGITTNSAVWPFAFALARDGFIVLAPQARWETRNLVKETHQTLNMLLTGTVMMGERVGDVLRSVDFLAHHPAVDSKRIGIAGWSMGGDCALFAGALDPRIKVFYLSSMLVSFGHLLDERSAQQSADAYIPFLLKQFGDKDQMAALIRPRPILFEHGLNDEVEPFAWANQTAHQIADRYGKLASSRLHFINHRLGHRLRGADMSSWFAQWLNQDGHTDKLLD